MNKFVELVKAYKYRNGLTYRDLGELSGLNYTLVFYVVKGKRSVTLNFCKSFSPVLGMGKIEALKLAGLLTGKKKQGDEAALPSSPCLENVTEIIANS